MDLARSEPVGLCENAGHRCVQEVELEWCGGTLDMHEKRPSLLAKLAPMFRGQTENVAVEGLGHILSGSQPARNALSDVLRAGGAEVEQIAEVRTQATGEDGARPDLAAFEEDGSECVLIEAKFWAGLTENQPVAYLQRLPDRKPSALLFVAPRARLESLWAELGRRITESDAGIALKMEKSDDALLSALVGGARRLVLVSWTCLLDRMAVGVSSAGDSQSEADIAQLRGLADREDAAAFLPLRSEELGPDVPRRLMGLKSLVDRATDRLVGLGLASTAGLRATPKATGYVRYLRIAGAGAEWGIDYRKWATLRDTPLWLILRGQEDGWNQIKPVSEIWEKLASFRRRDPPELFEAGGYPVMPFELPLGVEEDAVLEAIVQRLERIARLIGPV